MSTATEATSASEAAQRIQQEFARRGFSLRAWSIKNGYRPGTVSVVVLRWASRTETPHGGIAREIMTKLRDELRDDAAHQATPATETNDMTETEDAKTKDLATLIAKRLRGAIRDRGMNLTQAAASAGLPYRSLQNYCRAERAPSAESLAAIATGLGISIDQLLLGHQHPEAAMNPELQKLREAKAQAETALQERKIETKRIRQELAEAQRLENIARTHFESTRLAWIEAAEAHYGVEK